MDKKLAKIAEKTLFILSKKDWQAITIEEVYLKANIKKKFFKEIYNKQDLLINIIKLVKYQFPYEHQMQLKKNHLLQKFYHK